MLLILTSILRNSKSLKIKLYSPILVLEELYELFDFDNPQIKYLSIEWDDSLYPVNKLKKNKWIYKEVLNDKELIEEISHFAYALFKFLLFTNLIYSVEKIEINGKLLTEKIIDKLDYQLNKWRSIHHTAVNPIKNIYYKFPNLQLNNNQDDVACNFEDHIPGMVLEDSLVNEHLIFKQNAKSIDNQKYISEVEDLLTYFYKIENTNNNRMLVSTILYDFDCVIVFFYYQDSLFDVSIYLTHELNPEDIKITRKEKFIKLKASLNSSILSKTLEKGSQIKTVLFSNKDVDVFDYHPIQISFSANTLTIDWSRIISVNHLKYLKILLKLWPGLILRLEDIEYLEYWDEERLDWIQRLLIYCEGSLPCSKIFFSRVVISIDIDIDEIRNIKFFVEINKIKHLYDSLSKIYDVEFENITYEDLLKDRLNEFKEFIERQRDGYNNAKLKFERALKNSIERYSNSILNNTNDGINQAIAKLKLKEFQFYKSKIKLRRYD